MNNKLDLPFEFGFLPKDAGDMLKAGNTFNIKDISGVFLCTSGNIEVTIDQNIYKVHKDDLFFFIPSAFIHLSNISDDFKGIILTVSLEFVTETFNNVLDVKRQLYVKNHLQLSLNQEQSSNILRLMTSMYERIEQEDIDNISNARRYVLSELIKSLCKTLGLEILNMYLASHPMEDVIFDRNEIIFQQFVISLSQNYRKHRQVAYYAAEQCLSYSYFSQIIKEKSGKSALVWITFYVINDAKHMLEYTHASIKEIAYRLNFPTQTFFGKYFKQYTGISPKEYRKQVTNQSDTSNDKNLLPANEKGIISIS